MARNLGRFISLSAASLLLVLNSNGQATLTGKVSSSGKALGFSATVFIEGVAMGGTTNDQGVYEIQDIPAGRYSVVASALGFSRSQQSLLVPSSGSVELNFNLREDFAALDEVVVSGTMKAVNKLDSPVPVEVYSPRFFKANPTPSVYEALQTVNGVRPQINCSVCNTGDIHINGLEGSYTLVMIDGMPIVSGLSTVYGLNGIPTSLIERIEIVKGPASTLYGSEAVGGIINIITKQTTNAPRVSADAFGTSWGEVNADIAAKFKTGKRAVSLVGVNRFRFGQRIDKDGDGFTDMTLQDRISIFNKWNFKRKKNRLFTLAGRIVKEERFGGDMDWEADLHRGGNEVYGESIDTDRWELFGVYELPMDEHVQFQFSANGHTQNSVYGDTKYNAEQRVSFGQLLWDRGLGERQVLLTGLTLRYTYYDDNTPATATADTLNSINRPIHTYLPGIFVQNKISLTTQSKLLIGIRYDRNSLHGNILTPRLNFKWNSLDKRNTFRFSFGTGYRVVNVFTEDHAALTGTRDVIMTEDLQPETSINGNINYVRRFFTRKEAIIGLDATAFYTHFYNKIFPDYNTDPSQILYNNLDGFAVSQGVSLNVDVNRRSLKLLAGITALNVYTERQGVRERQALTEQFSGTWSIKYTIDKAGLSIDYTGNVYSPMELPTQTAGDFIDPRPSQSPWYSIQNVQFTKTFDNGAECYLGVKNLLNWTPWNHLQSGVSYLGNTLDPFQQNTPPNELVFDPAYVYGPNQGVRGFCGLRWTLN